MKIPKAIQNVTESFERLPGIGPKTAERLTFYLLHVPQGELDKFATAVQNLKKNTVICSICFNIGESDPCSICSDPERNQSMLCVVEQPLVAGFRNAADHGFEVRRRHFRLREQTVERVDVARVMLVVMEAHGALGNHRLEGVVGVGKIGKGEHP